MDGVTAAAGATIGIRAQLGFGDPTAGDPATAYRWTDMAWDSDVGGADRLVGAVRPEELGAHDVLLRISTDGGATWAYADRAGTLPGSTTHRAESALTLTAVAASDTEILHAYRPAGSAL